MVAARVFTEAARHTLFDHEAATQALCDRGSEGQAAVVTLRRSARHQRIGALRQCVSYQELELARFVAARNQAS